MPLNIILPSVSASLRCYFSYWFSDWRVLWICSCQCTLHDPPTLRPCIIST